MVVQPLVNIFCPRIIIDEISTTRDTKRLVVTIFVMIIATAVVNTFVTLLDNHLSKIYYEDFNRLLEANIGRKSMELKYETTENKETLDYISNAKLGISNAYSGGMNGFFKAFSLFVGNLCIFIITLIVVVKYSWVLLLIVVANISINMFTSKKQNKIQLAQFEKLAFIDRAYYYLLHTLSDIRFGKDIRLFCAKDMMETRTDNFNKEQSLIYKKQADRSQKYVIVSKGNMGCTEIFTYLILAVMALDGKISIGEFMMLSTSVSTLVLSMNTILKQILDLGKFTKYAEKYIEFLEKNQYEQSGDLACDVGEDIEIEFKNVSFMYPNQSKYALKNINIKINSKEHWSVVGLNGAGKTTFIKLLCRLYECTDGEILVNGVNILEYDYASYCKIIAAIFQDFQLLNFSIKENIIVGEFDNTPDSLVMEYIDRVGLSEKVNSLEMGLATPVFRYYDMNGFEPSGGEQQKIAMARALYKDAPMLILDEPTAALDPIAEKDTYERFNEMTENKVAIFISHRLASCKFCKNILVFSEGEIVEQGTHESLIQNKEGLYAKMYTAQEKYYL